MPTWMRIALWLAVAASLPVAPAFAKDIVIGTAGLEPAITGIDAEEEIDFVNRSGRGADVVFEDRLGHHHVYTVAGRITAVFHRPGRHQYVVRFTDPAHAPFRGIIEVSDGRAAATPPTCSTITVDGACIER